MNTFLQMICSEEAIAPKNLRAETSAEPDALLPAILERAFKGDL